VRFLSTSTVTFYRFFLSSRARHSSPLVPINRIDDSLTNRAYAQSPLTVSLFFPFGRLGDGMFHTKEYREACRDVSSTIDFVVSSLGPDTEMLLAEILDMGTSNGIFAKARPEHLAIVGDAVLWALQQSLKCEDGESDQLFEKGGSARSAWEHVVDQLTSALRRVLKPSRRASTQ